MSPYRDSLDALRARLAGIERAIAEKRAAEPRTAPSSEKRHWRRLSFFASTVALAVLGVSLYHLQAEYRELLRYQARVNQPAPLAAPAKPRRWRAHVFTSDVAHLADGAECSVAIDAPCTATVSCGTFGYRGRGTCSGDGGFVDRADSDLDGSPECEIDVRAGRVLLRELAPDAMSGHGRRWFADLELVRE